ncbi:MULTISPECIES: RagB/SusD family nutrient uptake outer membrane protein [Butyricimonas]|uniref:RagB/SusD family nutrient uptake outer membrane protein n=1 Tax=Butyricimonas TaxID=574697 RepID=UPI0007FB3C95|nr:MULTISPECIES: RagB/SusD family nutrient uptake outer membrane protein [Butyricimonas]
MKKILIILFAGVWTACSDFLEPKSQSEYIPKEATALNEMLIGEAYPRPGSDGAPILDIISILDDDVMCTNNSETDLDETLNGEGDFMVLRALFSWQPDVYDLMEKANNNFNRWANYYEYVLGTNAALDYLEDVSGTEDEKNIVRAQALALRGFYYFYLVNIWGESYSSNKTGLGVPLKLTSSMEKRDIRRNTVEEVYEQILKDLGEAEKLYEQLPEQLRFKKDYRTSLPMVQMLKSRVYLYMEDWKNAAIYAKKVIENWNFSLLDLNTLPEGDSYYNFISMDCPEAIWVFGSISRYMTYLDYSVYLEDPWDSDKHIGINFFNASDELLNLYVEEDLRKKNYILRERYKDSWGEVYDGEELAIGKFAITPDHRVADDQGFAHAFRLPEAYLNLAEAAAKDRDDETALWALNELRRHRFSGEYEPISGISGEALVEKIRLERRLELCFECHRWFDLKRYGNESITHQWKVRGEVIQGYVLPPDDPFYAHPFSREVLEQNRSLIQNKLPNPR